MEEVYITGKAFDKDVMPGKPLAKGEYEDCTFTGCDLGNAGLDGFTFTECTFSNCNLAMATIRKTAFRDVLFDHCKLLGLRFDTCNPFNLSFRIEACQLHHACFFQLKIRKTIFRHSQLTEADFTTCDLGGAVFDNCDLSGAIFDQTNLEQADLRTASNYTIDPDRNKIRKARFSFPAVATLLDKYDIEIE